MLLVTPVALTLGRLLQIRDRARITKIAVLVFLLTAACFLIFGDPSPIAAELDVFFAVLSVTGITLASAIAETEQAQREQGALQARLAAEQVVRASEERLRLAQQAARIGTFERDIHTGVVTWTREVEAMYGLPPGGFDGTTATFFENLVYPDDRDRIAQLSHKAIKTGKPIAAEWRVLWPDGSVHWIAGRWQVLMNESGQPLRMIGVNMDVTERKLGEEKLQEYERAVENSGEMITVVDRDYRYLIANRRYLKMRNLRREEVVGYFVHEVVDQRVFQAALKPKLDECFRGGGGQV